MVLRGAPSQDFLPALLAKLPGGLRGPARLQGLISMLDMPESRVCHPDLLVADTERPRLVRPLHETQIHRIVVGSGNLLLLISITLSPIIEPPQFIAVTLTNGAPQFLVQGQPGFTYVIEATTNLLAPPALIPWTPLFTSGTRPNGQFPFADPDSTNFPRRFYRVVRP